MINQPRPAEERNGSEVVKGLLGRPLEAKLLIQPQASPADVQGLQSPIIVESPQH